MGIQVKCFATLAGFEPEHSDDYPVVADETVASLIRRLGMKEDDVNLMFVNSQRAFLHSPVKDGDRVGLFPAVGGG